MKIPKHDKKGGKNLPLPLS